MKRSNNAAASIKTAKNQSHVNGNAKGVAESAKSVNGDASKTNGHHVNGMNNGAPEVNLRTKKTTRVNEDGGRTTMVVRLHPGQTNRLSAYVEDQVIKERKII